MTVRELREKLEGIPDYYTVEVLTEHGTLMAAGEYTPGIDVNVHTNDMTLTISI